MKINTSKQQINFEWGSCNAPSKFTDSFELPCVYRYMAPSLYVYTQTQHPKNLEEMASNLLAMAFNLEAMASHPLAVASNLEEMASNLLAMAFNLETMASNLEEMA